MSASITEAHRKLAYELMQMDDRLSAFAHRTAAQLIANSEARAVAAAVTALTCTHHNNQQRVACPVCLVTALTAERDKLRAQNDQFSDNLSAVGAVYNAEKARAERAEAEAERYRLVTLRLDAELAIERARLDYLSTRGFEHRHHGNGDHLAFEWTISSTNELKDVSLREVIDEAMKEDAK